MILGKIHKRAALNAFDPFIPSKRIPQYPCLQNSAQNSQLSYNLQSKSADNYKDYIILLTCATCEGIRKCTIFTDFYSVFKVLITILPSFEILCVKSLAQRDFKFLIS